MTVQRRSLMTIALGPTRHRQPLTAAALHLEVEQEQEAVVRGNDSGWQLVLTDQHAPR